jgi:hypothetical protein
MCSRLPAPVGGSEKVSHLQTNGSTGPRNYAKQSRGAVRKSCGRVVDRWLTVTLKGLTICAKI